MTNTPFDNADLKRITIYAKNKLAILAIANLFALILFEYPSLSADTILFLAAQFALMYFGILTYVWRILFSVQAVAVTCLCVLLIMELFTGSGKITTDIINILLCAIPIPSAIMLYKDSDIAYYLKYKWLFKSKR